MGNKMKIVLAHQGPISELIAATSVNHGIKNKPVDTELTWVVAKGNEYIFRYNQNVNRVLSIEDFEERGNEKYDLCINLWPGWIKTRAILKECCGFRYTPNYSNLEEAIINEKSISDMSNLQMYFLLSGLTWGGEGYDIPYFPKSRSKRNRVGIAVANSNLRNYILEKINLENGKIWNIPYRKNIFKKMDEINRCKKIVTDDLTIFHLAMSLRKYVYLLEVIPFSFRMEMFGNGEIHKVPINIIR